MKVTIDDRTGNGTLIKIGLGFVLRKQIDYKPVGRQLALY